MPELSQEPQASCRPYCRRSCLFTHSYRHQISLRMCQIVCAMLLLCCSVLHHTRRLGSYFSMVRFPAIVFLHQLIYYVAHIPLFLYPFLNTTSKTRPFEYLRLTSLGVIGALVKVLRTHYQLPNALTPF